MIYRKYKKVIDINKGTPEGTEEEINFVRLLNEKKYRTLWNVMEFDPDSHFAIHVIYHKNAKINGTEIKPKADVFIAEGDIPEDLVNKKNFYLNEDDAVNLGLKPCKFSGISVKRKDSSKYQIMKMNPNTFKKIFLSFELGAGASIYCRNYEELKKNASVLRGWNTTWEKFKCFFSVVSGIAVIDSESSDHLERLKVAIRVKKLSNERIGKMISENRSISEFIFQGVGNFEEPFTATWFYEKGLLRKAGPIPFTVTTGSGRSHGDFTVVIKPK